MEPIRNVLVAVDLSDRSAKVVAAAARIVSESGARFRVLHVIRDLVAEAAFYDASQDLGSVQGDLERRAHEQLRALAHSGLAARPVEVEVRSGVPWSEILAAALHHRVDLVVMGAHFRDEGPAKPRVLADAVTKVSQMAPCPVLVVPTAAED